MNSEGRIYKIVEIMASFLSGGRERTSLFGDGRLIEGAKMDPELLRQKNAMKQRAIQYAGAVGGQTGGKDKVKSKPKSKSKAPSSLAAMVSKQTSSVPMSISSYAAAQVPQQFRTKNKLGVLKMIVDKLRERHMERISEPLPFDEILKAINYSDMSPNMRDFLQQAVRDNPKIACKDGGKFTYKPLYSLKNSAKLLALLKRKEEEGLPAVLLADIRESMPRWEKVMKNLNENVLTFQRPDKQVVVFHNEAECRLPIGTEYQQLWRGISVEGLSDHDIETYLQNAGISTMKGQTLKPPTQSASKKNKRGQKRQVKTLNVHLSDDMLKDYSETSEK
ncbi:general transcription factor IIE subunit 2-like [Sycon ciliatum]|uniref:general transcription factor IIE subunit 2-like n=1 Tax=Sycon ciliatum TaxID=27933 RepID=UPI0020AEE63F|eukprot:scpid79882/ scgid24210/ Transcription initiation factor IIE subunit beta; General transcription factor IIE subunit 2